MPKISKQTKSFIILFAIALFGVGFSIFLSSDLSYLPAKYSEVIYDYKRPDSVKQIRYTDTSNWKTYTNPEFKLSFKYRPDWKILSAVKKENFTVLQIDPGKKYYNIKIYISPQDFYIMGGLPIEEENISGVTAFNVQNALYGIKTNKLYYTFDVGLSMSLLPDFNTLVHSVNFQS